MGTPILQHTGSRRFNAVARWYPHAMSATACLPELCLLVAAGVWSLASGVYKKASARADILQVNLFRCAVSVVLGAVTVAVVGTAPQLSEVTPAMLWYMASSGILARLVGDSLFFYSASRIGLARAMPIAAIYPVWSVLIAAANGEPVTGRELLAMALTLVGVVLVIRSGAEPGSRRRAGRSWEGYLLAVGCSLAWALGLLHAKWGAGHLDPFLVNTLRMAAGGVSLVVVLRFQGRPLFPAVPTGRPALLGAAFLESWLGSAAYMYGVAHTSTAVGSTLSSLAPVFTIPVAAWYLKERMSAQLILGILLATAGVIGLMV